MAKDFSGIINAYEKKSTEHAQGAEKLPQGRIKNVRLRRTQGSKEKGRL
jgi:hypothetical protein